MSETKEEQALQPTVLPEGLVSTRDLARHYKIKLRTVQSAAAAGKIPGTFQVLGRYLFDFEVAKEWVPHEAVLRAEFGALTRNEVTGRPTIAKGVGLSRADTAVRFAAHAVSKLPKREAALYHRALTARLTPESWIEIVDTAIAEAKAGGVDGHRARTWLGNYVLGKPLERVKAQLDLHVKKEYSQAQRASAIRDLLLGAKLDESEVVDVPSRRIAPDAGAESDSDGPA